MHGVFQHGATSRSVWTGAWGLACHCAEGPQPGQRRRPVLVHGLLHDAAMGRARLIGAAACSLGAWGFACHRPTWRRRDLGRSARSGAWGPAPRGAWSSEVVACSHDAQGLGGRGLVGGGLRAAGVPRCLRQGRCQCLAQCARGRHGGGGCAPAGKIGGSGGDGARPVRRLRRIGGGLGVSSFTQCSMGSRMGSGKVHRRQQAGLGG